MSGFQSVDHIIKHLTPDFVRLFYQKVCSTAFFKIRSKSQLFSEADFVLVDTNLSVESLQAVTGLAKEFSKKGWAPYYLDQLFCVHSMAGADK